MSNICEVEGCGEKAEPGKVYSRKRRRAMDVCEDHWEDLVDEGEGGYLADCPCCGVQFESS